VYYRRALLQLLQGLTHTYIKTAILLPEGGALGVNIKLAQNSSQILLLIGPHLEPDNPIGWRLVFGAFFSAADVFYYSKFSSLFMMNF
jgi:hypothetical protein